MCAGHSGRRSAPPRWGGTGTALWLPRTGSSLSPRSPPARCPGSCRRTLWGKSMAADDTACQYQNTLLMSQAGHLYSFSPSTKQVTGASCSSSPAFPLFFSSFGTQPKPKPDQIPSAGYGGGSGWSGQWHTKQCRALLTHPATHLPCQAVSGAEGKEGLPPHCLVLAHIVQTDLQGYWCRQKPSPHPLNPISAEKANKKARNPPPAKAHVNAVPALPVKCKGLPSQPAALLQGSGTQCQLEIIRFPSTRNVQRLSQLFCWGTVHGWWRGSGRRLPTHFCSPAAGRSRNSPVCRSGSFHPLYDTGTSGTFPSSCRRPPGQYCRCCCCIGTAGRRRQHRRGSQRSQTHIHHIDCLFEQTGTVGITITAR